MNSNQFKSAILDPSPHRRDVLRLGLAASVVAALGPRAAFAADKKVIGFGQPDRTANYYKGLLRGVDGRATEYGYEVRQIFSGLNAQKQLSELNAWLASGVDAMIVLALDANAMGPVVKKCKEQGVLFISYAVVVEGSDGYLAFDDKDAGTVLGKHLVEFIKKNHGGKAEVGFMTFPTAQVTIDRIQSVQAVLKKELPDTPMYEAEGPNAADGLKSTQSMLQAHPDLRIIIGCSDDGCLGARSAFINNGISDEKVFIAGFDGAPQVLELLKQKDAYIKASMGLDIERLGQRSIEIPHAIWANPNVAKSEIEIKEPYLLLTSDTDVATIDRLLSAYR
ncbi:sugar ABC transporter substrate-binding protein [Corticibacterium sp. UT-5YL-CI-8]|nr:sugar ABC transporter substrate-binding protein [Tianweitania sp. UT-5YL-CI-8]